MLLKRRISVTGPEASGKSVLVNLLAKHYNAGSVDEFSREYLKDSPEYNFDDILAIAKNQLLNEDKLAQNSGLLFCDTDILVNRVWSHVVYKKGHKWIDDSFLNHQYGLYLLCYPDLEWEYDPLRENPTNRFELFDIYENELIKAGFNYKIIDGKGKNRLEKALNFVDEYLKCI